VATWQDQQVSSPRVGDGGGAGAAPSDPGASAAEPTWAAGAAEPIWAMGTHAPAAAAADLASQPLWPAPEPRRRASPRYWLAELAYALVVALVVAALGLPLGWLWARISPHVVLEMTAEGPSFTEPNPEGYVGGESVYLLIGVGLGILSAIVVWLLLRNRRGPILLTGLALGCVVGAVLMAWLGHRIGLSEYERLLKQAPVGTRFEVPVKVRSSRLELPFVAQGAVLIQALIAVATYTVLAGFSATASLRSQRRRTHPPPVTPV
jgi:uncharacterized protein DUF2567